MIHFAIIKYTVSHFFFQLLDKVFLQSFSYHKNFVGYQSLKIAICKYRKQYRFLSILHIATPTPKRLMVFFACTPSKTSGAIHAALPLLFVMCVWISQAVPKSQIFRTVPPIINSRLEEEDHQM